jgi:hypothetical protein
MRRRQAEVTGMRVGGMRIGAAVGLVLALGLLGLTARGARAAEVPVAHVHRGSCGHLGDVVYVLGPADEAMAGMPGMATPTPNGMAGMPGMAPTPVLAVSKDGNVVASVTIVDAALADLIGGDYAVNVHAGAEDIARYVACGDLSAATMVGDQAVAPLHERDGSGWSGFVVLRPLPSGTEVDLYLAHGLTGAAATPSA